MSRIQAKRQRNNTKHGHLSQGSKKTTPSKILKGGREETKNEQKCRKKDRSSAQRQRKTARINKIAQERQNQIAKNEVSK